MAKTKEKNIAIRLRNEGHSYSAIRNKLHVSKGTLSAWLRHYPLSHDRIAELRDRNPQRIERFRNTMSKKRQGRLDEAYKKVKKSFSKISSRELYIAGFYLYWAEGLKTAPAEVSLSNTDPSMLKLFVKWLELLGAEREKIHVRLHLYTDMDIKKQTFFWSRQLDIPLVNFSKPYIKKAKHDDYQRKGRFGYGTCNIRYFNQPMNDFVLMGIKYLREHADMHTM